MLDWFIAKMKREFGVEVKGEEVGYEAYEFYHDEMDVVGCLSPVEVCRRLIETESHMALCFFFCIFGKCVPGTRRESIKKFFF
ncbi:hypothetical protein [Geobacillus stearothermophilus]|uniref:hypothetical protein n=1 Tax=Geobacillus stearothermophilus TaxID=1422 RepID=UPI002E1D9997|nr:hypothetical protein [Geobacillus stearothermophilus]